MVFLTGFSSDLNGPDMMDRVKTTLVGLEDHALIDQMEYPKKNSIVLYFHEEKTISAFIKKYANKEFLGGKAKLSQG